jgi:uncharacterized FlaG/YvyC family protein
MTAMNEIDLSAALGSAEGVADGGNAEARRTVRETPSRAETDRDTVRVESLVRATASRLVVDAATKITQIEILDPATKAVLREYPDSDWLKIVRASRAMAAEAIVDKHT